MAYRPDRKLRLAGMLGVVTMFAAPFAYLVRRIMTYA